MKTYKFALLFLVGVIFTTGPASAHAASLQITEVMYDPPGTGGAQWIEVYNPDSAAVALTAGSKGWRVDDGGSSKHLLVDPASASPAGGRGSLNVPAGGFVIITNDPTSFIAQYNGSYSVIKSAIAPKTTGGTISLLNADGSAVDTASYAGGKGAAGYNDGNSLHRSSNTFTSGTPDPGVFSGASTPAGTSSAPSDTSVPAGGDTPAVSDTATDAGAVVTTDQTSNADVFASGGSGVPNAPPLIARITAAASLVIGAGSSFSGVALDTKGGLVTGAVYEWNFGDGVTSGGQKVFHTYMYPGKYALMLTVSSGYSMGTGYVTVDAMPAHIALQAQSDGSVILSNLSAQNTNVGLWSIGPSAGAFVIPQNTILLAKQSIHFAPSILGFSGGGDTELYYPNGLHAATSSVSSAVQASSTTLAGALSLLPTLLSATSSLNIKLANAKKTPSVLGPIHVAILKTESSSGEAGAGAEMGTGAGAEATSAALSAAVSNAVSGGATLIFWESVLGLGALVVLGAAGVWYVKPSSATKDGKDKLGAEDFSVDEVDEIDE